MTPILVNLSFYRFYRVGDALAIQELRKRVKSFCQDLDVKGTVLLAHEGVNAMLSGPPAAIERLKAFARDVFGVEDRAFKESSVESESFTRLLVKIKSEIISVGDPDLRPDQETAKRLSPAELKRWLDERRPMVLLDTRNRYEVEVGTFKSAQDLGLEVSRDFSAQAASHAHEWRGMPVVTFCTGGIRCEKASAALLKLGLDDVYQLDGGILRYFEENGSEHFEGNCFVFDWRLAVDGNLQAVPRSSDPDQTYGRHRKN